jgi:hypothetical protein
MNVTVWKEGEELEPGKLILADGYYLIFLKEENGQCVSKHPFQKGLNVQVPLSSIKAPLLTGWAEGMIEYINRRAEPKEGG